MHGLWQKFCFDKLALSSEKKSTIVIGDMVIGEKRNC